MSCVNFHLDFEMYFVKQFVGDLAFQFTTSFGSHFQPTAGDQIGHLQSALTRN